MIGELYIYDNKLYVIGLKIDGDNHWLRFWNFDGFCRGNITTIKSYHENLYVSSKEMFERKCKKI